MQDLKSTQKDSVGTFWRIVRPVSTLGIMASGFVFAYVTHLAGFMTLLVACVLSSVADAKLYLVSNLYRINVITSLRERLLNYGDHEYILESIKKDQIWRGDPVDPSITVRLAQFNQEREDFKNKVLELAGKVFDTSGRDEKPSN